MALTDLLRNEKSTILNMGVEGAGTLLKSPKLLSEMVAQGVLPSEDAMNILAGSAWVGNAMTEIASGYAAVYDVIFRACAALGANAFAPFRFIHAGFATGLGLLTLYDAYTALVSIPSGDWGNAVQYGLKAAMEASVLAKTAESLPGPTPEAKAGNAAQSLYAPIGAGVRIVRNLNP